MLKNPYKITAVKANYMLAYEKYCGCRKETISRTDIENFKNSWSLDEKGPSGLKLRSPSWLTNTDHYRTARGEYKLPWDELDEFLKGNPLALPNKTLRDNARKNNTETNQVAEEPSL